MLRSKSVNAGWRGAYDRKQAAAVTYGIPILCDEQENELKRK